MGQILVRNLEDRLIAKLKQRALERGTSLEQLARDALTREAERVDHTEWFAQLSALRAEFKPDPGGPTAVELVRETWERERW